MRFQINTWRSLAVISTAAMLAACSEPPACGDMDVAKTLKNIVLQEAEKQSRLFAHDPRAKKLMDRLTESLQFSIANVRSDGYNREAKARMCQAELTVAGAQDHVKQDVVYKIQLTEDKGGDAMVLLEDAASVVRPIADARTGLAVTYTDAGEWDGTYRCEGVDGDTSGPRGPFEQKVGFTSEALRGGELKRTTQGGGVETLRSNWAGGMFSGEGQNSPDDKWKVEFKGKVSGYEYVGQGAITALDGEVLRRCELRLTQTPIAELPSLASMTAFTGLLR